MKKGRISHSDWEQKGYMELLIYGSFRNSAIPEKEKVNATNRIEIEIFRELNNNAVIFGVPCALRTMYRPYMVANFPVMSKMIIYQ